MVCTLNSCYHYHCSSIVLVIYCNPEVFRRKLAQLHYNDKQDSREGNQLSSPDCVFVAFAEQENHQERIGPFFSVYHYLASQPGGMVRTTELRTKTD